MDEKQVVPGLKEIGQIALPVHDLKRAIDFYRKTLGMNFLFEIPGTAFFDCSGIRLMLSVPEKPEFDHPASIIYYRVDDIQERYEVLTAQGVIFEGKPHLITRMDQYDLWMAFLRDTEDNLLALMSEVGR